LQTREWEWISSEVVDDEIAATSDPEQRSRLQVLASFAHRRVAVGPREERCGADLERMGFHPYDALHIACAESGGALILLTTDDQRLSVVSRCSEEITVKVENPLTWLRKEMGKWTYDA
jgi:predicted nucleic acid-binding protein